jgi:hypothetical protein
VAGLAAGRLRWPARPVRSPHHGGAIGNAGGRLTVINVVFKHNTAVPGCSG